MKTIKNDDHAMSLALKEATKSLKNDEVPVGALVVNKEGIIIAKAYNQVERLQTQLGHAETLAIKKACNKLKSWRLNGCWIYVTLEPCLMCLGLIHLSRIEGVCFGAPSTLFGTGLGKINTSLPFYASKLKIVEGVRSQECLGMLQNFFKTVRKRKVVDRETEIRLAQ